MYLFRQDYCSMSVQLFLLSKNGMESMKKLSTFLGTSTDPKFLQAVYDTCSIEEVKKRLKSPIDVIFYRKGNLQNFKTIVNFFDLVLNFKVGCNFLKFHLTLIRHLKFFKFVFEGIVGDWKSSFTDADNKKFDQVYKEKMKDSKLKIRFS